MNLLQSVGAAITTLPESFVAHRQIKKIYEARREMIETGECEVLQHIIGDMC
jgi:2-oxoglutarate dehydrogenase E1 component